MIGFLWRYLRLWLAGKIQLWKTAAELNRRMKPYR